MWGEKSVAHIDLVDTGVLKLLAQHISHGALQQPRHFLVAVSIKDTITSFHTVSKAVYSQHRHTQPVPSKRTVLTNNLPDRGKPHTHETWECDTSAPNQGKQHANYCDPEGAARHTGLPIVMHLTLLQALNSIQLLGSTAPATLEKVPITALMLVLGACQWFKYWLSSIHLLSVCAATSKLTDIQYIQSNTSRFQDWLCAWQQRTRGKAGYFTKTDWGTILGNTDCFPQWSFVL